MCYTDLRAKLRIPFVIFLSFWDWGLLADFDTSTAVIKSSITNLVRGSVRRLDDPVHCDNLQRYWRNDGEHVKSSWNVSQMMSISSGLVLGSPSSRDFEVLLRSKYDITSKMF